MRTRLLAVLLASLATPSLAQTPITPATEVTMVPSPDHSTGTGGAAVISYTLDIKRQDTGAVVQTIPIGKPAPQGDTLLHILPFGPPFLSQAQFDALARGVTFVMTATAVGSGPQANWGVSTLSNPFVVLVPPPIPTCTATLSQTSASVPAPGGTGDVQVTTQAGCNWQTSSPSPWVTVSPVNGQGSRLATWVAQANTATAARTAALTIAGVSFTLTQSGATPTPTGPRPPGAPVIR